MSPSGSLRANPAVVPAPSPGLWGGEGLFIPDPGPWAAPPHCAPCLVTTSSLPHSADRCHACRPCVSCRRVRGLPCHSSGPSTPPTQSPAQLNPGPTGSQVLLALLLACGCSSESFHASHPLHNPPRPQLLHSSQSWEVWLPRCPSGYKLQWAGAGRADAQFLRPWSQDHFVLLKVT